MSYQKADNASVAMKQPFYLYLVIVSLLLQIGGNSLLVMHYSLNKAYITKQFCVNKQNLQLACEGSCHLQKQAKQLDENTASGKSKQLKVNAEVVWMYQKFSSLSLDIPPVVLIQFFSAYGSFYISPLGTDFFHPPRQEA
ncbi:hypothetical protein D770_21175 [Flammeovirgaceae bacterium 311]|nr:hypothetical protein D770_21175 [Flammeovirgaceae bacterium 311]